MKTLILLIMPVFIGHYLFAQRPDTLSRLPEVNIKAYFNPQPAFSTPSSVGIISSEQLRNLQPWSNLPALNAIPGVKMDERSPGSYRLSIRGSLIRSPYGVRNVKVYLGDYMLSDAGGNSYLSSIDNSAIGNMEVIKGPEGSIYGANTGGVLLIAPDAADSSASPGLTAGLSGGSFGLMHQYFQLRHARKKVNITVKQAWQRSDGYRVNSSMDRKYYQVNSDFNYAPGAQLNALLLYSDMRYRTPGGLTESQMLLNPRAARPAAGPNPGSADQKAGIYNRTLFTGLSNTFSLTKSLRHVLALNVAYTDFRNPFITNYEHRFEQTLGLRSYLEWNGRMSEMPFSVHAGIESQSTASKISNYGNRGGIRDTMQTADDIRAAQTFAFLHSSINFSPRLLLELAASLNFYHYTFDKRYPSAAPVQERKFDPQMLPRLALSYSWPKIAWRASLSRGYSSPTIAEIRPSDQQINSDLEAEYGWNYESGFRFSLFQGRFFLDMVYFSFDMKSAIIRQVAANGNEFFRNAGALNQRGLESQLSYLLVSRPSGRLLRSVRVNNSYTLSRFFFRQYSTGDADYAGNRLTGVPRHSLVTELQAAFSQEISVNIRHQYNSATPLNDANTAWAKAFHLLQTRVAWTPGFRRGCKLSIFAGADNLLNQQYSLGNDLNAFGNRFYNPAPTRNYYAGLAFLYK